MGQAPTRAVQPDDDMEGMDVNAELLLRRQRLISAVQSAADTQQAAHDLICLDCPVSLKYAELDVKRILLDNNKTLNELRQIPTTLYVLEKYGRHLLKPLANRADMWRYVKFSNPIFRERVEALKGARAIMKQLGYREEVDDGLYFPDLCEPDPLYTVNLVADIVLARREMEAYLGGYHPRPHSLEEFIPLSTREVVHTMQPKSMAAQETEPTPGLFNPPQSMPLQPSRAPASTPSPPPSSRGASLEPSSNPPHPPTPTTPQPCDICGDKSACKFCETCDHKQLCEGCDQKWHRHPKRQQHVRLPLDSSSRPPLPSRPALAVQGKYGVVQASPERSPSFTPPPPIRIPQSSAAPGTCVGGPLMSSPGNVPNLDLLTFHSSPESTLTPSSSSVPGTSESAPQPAASDELPPSRPPRSTLGTPPSSGEQGGPPSRPLGAMPPAAPRPTPHVSPVVHGYVNVTSSSGGGGGSSTVTTVAPASHSLSSHGYVNQPGSTTNVVGSSGGSRMAADPPVHWPPPTTVHQQTSSASFSQQALPSSHPAYYGAPPYSTLAPGMNSPPPPHLAYGNPPSTQSAPPFPLPQAVGYHQPGTDPTLMHQQPFSQVPGSYATLSRPNYGSLYSAPHLPPNPQPQPVLMNSVVPGGPYAGKQPVRFQAPLPRPAWPAGNMAAGASPSMPLASSSHPASVGGEGSSLSSRSKLLQRVLQEPTREKQQVRAEIQVATLEEDIEELREEMNRIIIASENFDQDPEYRRLTRKQGLLVREKAELERFLGELHATTAGDPATLSGSSQEGSMDNGLHIYYPPNFDASAGVSASNAGASSFVQASVAPLAHPPVAPLAHPPVAPLAHPPGVQQGLPPYGHPAHANTSSNAKTSQHPFPTPAAPALPGEKVGTLPPGPGMSVGPPKRPAPEVWKVSNQPSSVLPLQLSMPGSAMAPGSSMTVPRPSAASSNPSRVGQNTRPRRPVSMGGRSGYLRPWHCEHCTFANQAGTRICCMCDKTSDNPRLVEDGSAPGRLQPTEGEEETTVVATAAPPTHVGRKINEVYDEIYYEKMEAKKRYEAEQRAQEQGGRQGSRSPALDNCLPTKSGQPLRPQPSSNAGAGAGVGGVPGSAGPRTLADRSNPSPATRPSQMPLAALSTVPGSAVSQGPAQNNGGPGVASLERPSLSTLSSSSLTEARATETSLRSGEEMDVRRQLERLSREKEIQEMTNQGADLVYMIKACDRQGFSMEEVAIALKHYQPGRVTPMQWLTTVWRQKVEEVVVVVAERSKQLEQNDVGELTEEEAKEALRKTQGEIEAAVAQCIAARQALYQRLNPGGQLPREEVLRAMAGAGGQEEVAEDLLTQDALAGFRARIWEEGRRTDQTELLLRRAATETCSSISNSVISDQEFERQVFSKELDHERRVRMVLVEGRLQGWGRANLVIRIIDEDLDGGFDCSLEDVVEAVRNCSDRHSAIVYLRQTCELCLSTYPMSKIRNLNVCQCKMCFDCMSTNFKIAIREKHVRHWSCPICSLPDWNDEELSSNYLQFLSLMLKTSEVDKETLQLFETKIRDWHLQKEQNFRWCTHCGNGFIWDEGDMRLAMTCPHCSKKTCFLCKRQWEDQHDGITCEQYEQWKIDNDPNNQQAGLARHLAEHGIDCPSCKMRFSLARGGCMHFKCPVCAHEFCSGCSRPFYHDNCSNPKHQGKGLHCHHPRDCFYYLRDNSVQELQKLLQMHEKAYNTEVPESQQDKQHCPVVEQKEMDQGHQDEPCGKDSAQGQAGLCLSHYKEYLVTLINRDKLDPVGIMNREDMENLLKREDKQVPPQRKESAEVYLKRLVKHVQNQLPLKKK